MPVGFDDLTQTFFRAAIAAIGVGVVAFNQFLKARLHVLQGSRGLKIECFEARALHFAQPPFAAAVTVCRIL